MHDALSPIHLRAPSIFRRSPLGSSGETTVAWRPAVQYARRWTRPADFQLPVVNSFKANHRSADVHGHARRRDAISRCFSERREVLAPASGSRVRERGTRDVRHGRDATTHGALRRGATPRRSYRQPVPRWTCMPAGVPAHPGSPDASGNAVCQIASDPPTMRTFGPCANGCRSSCASHQGRAYACHCRSQLGRSGSRPRGPWRSHRQVHRYSGAWRGAMPAEPAHEPGSRLAGRGLSAPADLPS